MGRTPMHQNSATLDRAQKSLMAAEEIRKKLLPHERVEVRSEEDGFLGSWHTCTIISCEYLARVVQYDHLLNDEGSSNLTERVIVSPAVEGCTFGGIVISDKPRGRIRPLLPSSNLGPWCLPYGQCVDLFHEDAWWEGVVFDKKSGSEQRSIFFPDLGDEMEVRIDKLRSSKDWDEISEEWKPRKNWQFLEVIEEFEQNLPLPVSVKQIWYEVRMKSDFKKLREWTSTGWDIWRELVCQVLLDNFRIVFKQLSTQLNPSWEIGESGQYILEFSETVFNAVLSTQGFCRSFAIIPCNDTFEFETQGMMLTDINDKSHHLVPKDDDPVPISTKLVSEQALLGPSLPLPILSHHPNENYDVSFRDVSETPDTTPKLPQTDHRISKRKACLKWQPAAPAFVPGPDLCPEAIEEYKELFKLKKKPSQILLSNARGHLLYLGWKIEVRKDKGVLRFRYFSPSGELFFSLGQVCRTCDLVCKEMGPPPLMLMGSSNGRRSPIRSADMLETESQSTSELPSILSPDVLIIEPEYCPEAVRDYCYPDPEDRRVYAGHKPDVKLRALRAKKHLSAIGWSFNYFLKGDRRELRYISPSGKIFYSLISACKWSVNADAITSPNRSPTVGGLGNVESIKKADGRITANISHPPLLAVESFGNFSSVNVKFKNLSGDSCELSTPERLSQSNEGEIYKTRISRERVKHDEVNRIYGSPSANKIRKLRQPLKGQGNISPDYSIPGRDASRRSVIASSSQKTPKTVLSSLIENNVVSPRTKVQYRGRNGVTLKEGRISRKGIKCSCCGEIFGLSKFEAHAGSTNHKPSANIFLEDGRSLLECRIQLRPTERTKRLSSGSCRLKKSPSDKNNDDICTICHYGGELVLCDQCPSSFHTYCLGLKEVADGDWFCPSCCCKICGNSKFYTRNGEITASSILTCYQCERNYHADCLREKGNVNMDNYHQGEWFCQETCKQICSGLRKLLGKPIPVTENLTWTLVKYTKPDSCDPDGSDDECSMESYSKLNVALSLMHECFEPVKEPTTRRDLVEDIIFNRRSELRRLNFPGFYTVLLEKNEELVSAATVRIYGEKVAEVPLVATRFWYRRLGMCRILMNELEKKLVELGVERLVLPAVPSVLHAWTNSFGFSVMNESEKLNFLDYTFLYFEGTVFCEKVLICNDSTTPTPSTEGTVSKSGNQVNKNLNVVFAGISSVCQVDQVEEISTVEQGSTSHAACTDNEKDNSSSGMEIMDQSTPKQLLPFQTVTNEKQGGDRNGGLLKCYKRRRICAC